MAIPPRTFAAAALALTLSGCSALFEPATGPSTSTTAPSVAATPAGDATASPTQGADVRYLQQMTQFTRQQLALAALATSRTKNPQLLALAKSMTSSRTASLQQIEDAAKSLGTTAPSMQSTDGASWPGILSSNQMQALATASDTQFDRLWPTAVTVTDHEAVTISRGQLSLPQGSPTRTVATQQIQLLSPEFVTANELAGTPATRATLPPR